MLVTIAILFAVCMTVTVQAHAIRRHGSSTIFRQLYPGSKPMVEVKINGVPRQLAADTGSADTFVFTSGTVCSDGNNTLPIAECYLGDLYDGDFEAIDGLFFRQVYGADGAKLVVSGSYGYATVEVAGLLAKRQIVAFANYTTTGQVNPGISGILGLAPRQDEAIYSTSNLPKDDKNQYNVSLDYPTFFDNVSQRGSIDPYFSIAPEGFAKGGYLTLGGLPPIEYQKNFTTAPLLASTTNATAYYVKVDGLRLGGTLLHNNSFVAYVDSGTPACLFPKAEADAINAAFNPPAIYNETTASYQTTCKASVPAISVMVGAGEIKLDILALYANDPLNINESCSTAVYAAAPGATGVLGTCFLENTVAVFDVGKQELRFAQHSYNQLASVL